MVQWPRGRSSSSGLEHRFPNAPQPDHQHASLAVLSCVALAIATLTFTNLVAGLPVLAALGRVAHWVHGVIPNFYWEVM